MFVGNLILGPETVTARWGIRGRAVIRPGFQKLRRQRSRLPRRAVEPELAITLKWRAARLSGRHRQERDLEIEYEGGIEGA